MGPEEGPKAPPTVGGRSPDGPWPLLELQELRWTLAAAGASGLRMAAGGGLSLGQPQVLRPEGSNSPHAGLLRGWGPHLGASILGAPPGRLWDESK